MYSPKLYALVPTPSFFRCFAPVVLVLFFCAMLIGSCWGEDKRIDKEHLTLIGGSPSLSGIELSANSKLFGEYFETHDFDFCGSILFFERSDKKTYVMATELGAAFYSSQILSDRFYVDISPRLGFIVGSGGLFGFGATTYMYASISIGLLKNFGGFLMHCDVEPIISSEPPVILIKVGMGVGNG